MTGRNYVDDYPGCSATYVGLGARHWTRPTSDVSDILGLSPSQDRDGRPRTERVGQVALAARPNSWSFSTQGRLTSTDFHHHLDFLLSALEGRAQGLTSLRTAGWDIDVAVYWLSRHGHGGPDLWPEQIEALAVLGLGVWFDVYFDESDEASQPLPVGGLTQNFQRLRSHWRRFGIPNRD